MRYLTYILLTAALMAAGTTQTAEAKRSKKAEVGETTAAESGKYEFRGAWIQTAWQDRYQRMSPADCRVYLEKLINKLYDTGFNAVIFQVRPEGDAFYRSEYEPWSRFLTGKQGKAPSPEWDPMEYVIKLCHERHMEFHAWINPYRMTASKSIVLDKQHLYHAHPDWFVRFEDKLYLNPGMPESRSFIRTIVKDIVSRYDIDALHMDDYFYPYPVAGKTFDDRACFEAYAPMMNFDVNDPNALGNFRRRSVDILIKSVHEDIVALKPWVRFGISPFGIYRNQKTWKGGSKTNGTQCFDDLYADVLFWAKNGWIDYIIPQIYWEMGHQLADYTTLTKWWNDNTPSNCHLYIGQSIERSLDDPKDSKPTPDLRTSHTHFMNKINLARGLKNIKGECFWYAYQIDDNNWHVQDLLRENIFEHPALVPAYKAKDDEAPSKVMKVHAEFTGKALNVSWQSPLTADPKQLPHYYNVYRFKKGERVNIDDMSHLYCQTYVTNFTDTDIAGSKKYTYVITCVDAYNNESKGVKKTFKIDIE